MSAVCGNQVLSKNELPTIMHAHSMYLFCAFYGFAQSIECATQSRNP